MGSAQHLDEALLQSLLAKIRHYSRRAGEDPAWVEDLEQCFRSRNGAEALRAYKAGLEYGVKLRNARPGKREKREREDFFAAIDQLIASAS